jgi:hypothetical protein
MRNSRSDGQTRSQRRAYAAAAQKRTTLARRKIRSHIAVAAQKA